MHRVQSSCAVKPKNNVFVVESWSAKSDENVATDHFDSDTLLETFLRS